MTNRMRNVFGRSASIWCCENNSQNYYGTHVLYPDTKYDAFQDGRKLDLKQGFLKQVT